MTYLAHDADDGVEAGLLTEAQLDAQPLWQMAAAQARSEFAQLPDDRRISITVRCLLNLLVEDALRTSAARIERHAPSSPADVQKAGEMLVAISDALRSPMFSFKEFLFQNMYFHPAVKSANSAAVQLMRRLFLHYVVHPETMGAKARARVAQEGLHRTVCDYVAGMTDRYALEEVRKFNLDQGVVT
jgi:dGTPase